MQQALARAFLGSFKEAKDDTESISLGLYFDQFKEVFQPVFGNVTPMRQHFDALTVQMNLQKDFILVTPVVQLQTKANSSEEIETTLMEAFTYLLLTAENEREVPTEDDDTEDKTEESYKARSFGALTPQKPTNEASRIGDTDNNEHASFDSLSTQSTTSSMGEIGLEWDNIEDEGKRTELKGEYDKVLGTFLDFQKLCGIAIDQSKKRKHVQEQMEELQRKKQILEEQSSDFDKQTVDAFKQIKKKNDTFTEESNQAMQKLTGQANIGT
jgi:hypothetical protein